MLKAMLLLLLGFSAIYAKNTQSPTKLTTLTTIKDYSGKQIIVVSFDAATVIEGTGCYAPNATEHYFLLDMGGGDFAKAQLSILLTALSTGTKVKLFGAGGGTGCLGAEEYLKDLSIVP